MKIRDYQKEDKDTIIALGNLLHPNYSATFTEKTNHLIVATQDNKVVGFLAFNILVDTIDIVDIVIDPQYRRLKIGTNLLKYLLKYDPKEITLEVSSQNSAAINFYQNNGFSQVGIRKKYYSGIDGYTMKKVL